MGLDVLRLPIECVVTPVTGAIPARSSVAVNGNVGTGKTSTHQGHETPAQPARFSPLPTTREVQRGAEVEHIADTTGELARGEPLFAAIGLPTKASSLGRSPNRHVPSRVVFGWPGDDGLGTKGYGPAPETCRGTAGTYMNVADTRGLGGPFLANPVRWNRSAHAVLRELPVDLPVRTVLGLGARRRSPRPLFRGQFPARTRCGAGSKHGSAARKWPTLRDGNLSVPCYGRRAQRREAAAGDRLCALFRRRESQPTAVGGGYMTPQEVLINEAYWILQTAKQDIPQLEGLVGAVHSAAERGSYVVVTGVGKNADVAAKAAATYCSLGVPSFRLDAFKALHGDLGSLKAGNLLIGVSKSGETPELVRAFRIAAGMGVHLAALTCTAHSALGEVAAAFGGYDVVLPCESEADSLGLAPTCSTTLLMAVCDAIGVVASARLGFTREAFHLRHPGGALGKMLEGAPCR